MAERKQQEAIRAAAAQAAGFAAAAAAGAAAGDSEAGFVDAVAAGEAASSAALREAEDAVPDIVLEMARQEASFHLAEAPPPKLPRANKSSKPRSSRREIRAQKAHARRGDDDSADEVDDLLVVAGSKRRRGRGAGPSLEALRALCRDLRLPVSGNKTALAARIAKKKSAAAPGGVSAAASLAAVNAGVVDLSDDSDDDEECSSVEASTADSSSSSSEDDDVVADVAAEAPVSRVDADDKSSAPSIPAPAHEQQAQNAPSNTAEKAAVHAWGVYVDAIEERGRSSAFASFLRAINQAIVAPEAKADSRRRQHWVTAKDEAEAAKSSSPDQWQVAVSKVSVVHFS